MNRNPEEWQRLLFKADRSLQLIELIEMQDMLKHQQSTAFNYLYRRFYISKPIIYKILDIQNNQCSLEISGGQVYFTLNRRGYFLDLKKEVLTVDLNTAAWIKVLPSLIEVFDRDEFRDPLTGGEICGDSGAGRKILTHSLNINGDGYPLLKVVLDPTSQYPKISPANQILSNSSSTLSNSLIEEFLAQRLFEEAGNFIVQGLELSSNSASTVLLSPGVSYIQGYKVGIFNPQIFNISANTSFIYLARDGKLSLTPQVKDSSLFLFIGRIEKEAGNLVIFPSEERNILISELEVLKEQSVQNEIDISQLNLQLNTLALTSTSTSSSIFTDSYISLKNSDIYHPLYSALINSAFRLVRPGIKSLELSFDSAKVGKLNNIKFNEAKTFCSLAYSSRVFLSQKRSSGFINLKRTASRSPILKLTPRNSSSSSSKFVTTVKPLTVLQNKGAVNIEVTQYLKSQEITVEGFGFSPNANNLKIFFDNKRIIEFNVLGNSQTGAESSTLQAGNQGTVNFSFNVPSDLELKTYLIEVTNDVERTSISWIPTSSQINEQGILPSNGDLAQSFSTDIPFTLLGFNLAFRRVPSSKVETLFNFSINQVKLGKPSSEAIYSGSFANRSVSVTSNGSSLTYVPLDFPLNLEAGEYALVINSLSEETDLFISDTTQGSLIQGIESTPQQVAGLKLFAKQNSQWDQLPNKSLTFEVVQAVAASNLGEMEFDLVNPLEVIDQAEIVLRQSIPQTCSSTLLYKSRAGWVEFISDLPLDQLDNTLSLKLQVRSKTSQVPVVDLKSSFFNLQTNQLSGSWISKNISTSPYQNVKSTFDYYLPLGTSIKVFFSSNQGETWEALESQNSLNDLSDLIDGNIPLYKATFTKFNLTNTVSVKEINQKTSEVLRTNLMMRVDFQTNYRWLVPFIQNFSALTF